MCSPSTASPMSRSSWWAATTPSHHAMLAATLHPQPVAGPQTRLAARSRKLLYMSFADNRRRAVTIDVWPVAPCQQYGQHTISSYRGSLPHSACSPQAIILQQLIASATVCLPQSWLQASFGSALHDADSMMKRERGMVPGPAEAAGHLHIPTYTPWH